MLPQYELGDSRDAARTDWMRSASSSLPLNVSITLQVSLICNSSQRDQQLVALSAKTVVRSQGWLDEERLFIAAQMVVVTLSARPDRIAVRSWRHDLGQRQA